MSIGVGVDEHDEWQEAPTSVIRFERLEVENFASYLGRHDLDLTPSRHRPVIVIMGGNGFGKSSLFDALNWGLYGGDYERDLSAKRERSIEDYVHEAELEAAADEGRNATMSATVYFNVNGLQYYITQELSVPVRRSAEGKLSIGTASRRTETIRVQRDGNHRRLEYSGVLAQSLPNNVRDYFLFDGDRIHALSQPGSSQEVQDALRRVVDLDLLSEARDDVLDVAKDFRRQANRASSGELREVEQRLEELRTKQEKAREDVARLREEELSLKGQVASVEARLVEFQESKPLQERRSDLEKHLRRLEDQQKQQLNDLRSDLAVGVFRTVSEPVARLLSDLNKLRNAGQIPSRISKQLLEDLLEQQRCLCGSALLDGTAEKRAIQERLEDELKRDDRQELLNAFFVLQTASSSVDRAVDGMRRADERLDQTAEDIREYDVALREVTERISELPSGDIAALERQRSERNAKIMSIAREQGQLAARLERLERDIADEERKRGRLNATQNEARRAASREQLAERAASALDAIYRRVSDDSRERVEELTRRRFAEFVMSGADYDVRLSDDYSLEALDSNGNPALQRLSLGQKQSLSLAFITAVSDVSEKNPPLAIDMPFGRLDGEVDKAIASELTEITHQLILFVLPDREWTEGIQQALRGKVAHMYRLQFDGTRRETTIHDQGTF